MSFANAVTGGPFNVLPRIIGSPPARCEQQCLTGSVSATAHPYTIPTESLKLMAAAACSTVIASAATMAREVMFVEGLCACCDSLLLYSSYGPSAQPRHIARV